MFAVLEDAAFELVLGQVADVGVPGQVGIQFRVRLAIKSQYILGGERKSVGGRRRRAGASSTGEGRERGLSGEQILHGAETSLRVIDVFVERILNHVSRRVVAESTGIRTSDRIVGVIGRPVG